MGQLNPAATDLKLNYLENILLKMLTLLMFTFSKLFRKSQLNLNQLKGVKKFAIDFLLTSPNFSVLFFISQTNPFKKEIKSLYNLGTIVEYTKYFFFYTFLGLYSLRISEREMYRLVCMNCFRQVFLGKKPFGKQKSIGKAENQRQNSGIFMIGFMEV